MVTKLIKMNFFLLKYSGKLEEIKGIYFLYLVFVALSILSETSMLLAPFTYIIGSVVIFGFLYNTESSYSNPSAFRDFNNNSIILQNSLPVTRNDFVKGRVLYILIVNLITAILLTPSVISILFIRHRFPINLIGPKQILLFGLGYYLFIVWGVLLGELVRISNGRTSEENKKRNKVVTGILFALIILNYFLQPYIPRIKLSLKYPFITIASLLIIILIVQIVWVFKKINTIDFHQ
ncbi:hypothetical protein [Serpentinicella alkaliphila]|uniref:ABC-2 family transporter n=1 Tax=Serpentinicella alkaliphila TaxID=1734049 RepID=A0A4R2SUI5_9FIRM|nr:hypothetical protein [Serpentinicella alkaliphila]QUH24978.1 hypothetical protein HZR23_03690 [Serpentinicella alkaliphila]TCP92156.1 hypothetical protein EDD79_10912 [Serpentinicella alkaliphila]